MHYSRWTEVTTVNDWTGETRVRHLRKLTSACDTRRVYTEVYELAGCFYWSANIHIPHRPDLSRLAYGKIAATREALPVAKARATRIAREALRAG